MSPAPPARQEGSPASATPCPSPGFFDLVEACGESGCPVCRCLDRAARRHLAALVAEHVTDPETRRRLADSWGVCAAHAAALGEAADAAFAVAVVCEGLLGRAQAWAASAGHALAGRRPGGRWRVLLGASRGAVAAPPRSRPRRCPACVELARAERGYLDTLASEIGDARLGVAYERSAGLCLPHLELAVARGRPGAARLAASAGVKLEALRGALRRFIDKHDHRARDPISEPEAAAWTGALHFLAGRAEVFGNEVPRPFAGGGPAGTGRRRPGP